MGGHEERNTMEVSMSSIVMQVGWMKRGLATLIAGVLLVVASFMGQAHEVDQHTPMGSKLGIGSGSNVVELGSKPGVWGSSVTA
jgi:hypothetical protein